MDGETIDQFVLKLCPNLYETPFENIAKDGNFGHVVI